MMNDPTKPLLVEKPVLDRLAKVAQLAWRMHEGSVAMVYGEDSRSPAEAWERFTSDLDQATRAAAFGQHYYAAAVETSRLRVSPYPSVDKAQP